MFISLNKYSLVVIQHPPMQHTLCPPGSPMCEESDLCLLDNFMVIDLCTAAFFRALKVCLLESLDSDLKVHRSSNCFIRVHTEQTHRTRQRPNMWTDICSRRDFMVKLYAVHVWNCVKTASIFMLRGCSCLKWQLHKILFTLLIADEQWLTIFI